MKKLSIFLFSVILICQSTSKAYSPDPENFVKELVSEAINKLSDKNTNDEEKSKFIEKVALENVDINALGFYTLGELRKSAEKENLIKYQKAFEKYFLKSLTSRLKDYSSSKFEIIGVDKKVQIILLLAQKLSRKMEARKLKLIGEYIQKIRINLLLET